MENGNNGNSKNYNFYLKGDNGKAVLLIHGITGTPSEMRYLGRSLHKAGFTVLCNTLPRHCATLKELKKVTWQELYSACVEDLKRLKAESQGEVFVGGLSMGALIGIHLAREFPDEVSGVVALAPTLFYDGWAIDKRKVLLDIFWHIPLFRKIIDIREDWPYGLKDESLRETMGRFYKNADANKFDSRVILFGSPFFPLANLYQLHLLAKVIKKELPSVKNPILIIHAREDDMTSPKNAEYIYNRIASVNKFLVLLDNSYHMITIDKDKDRVSEEVIKFLNNSR